MFLMNFLIFLVYYSNNPRMSHNPANFRNFEETFLPDLRLIF